VDLTKNGITPGKQDDKTELKVIVITFFMLPDYVFYQLPSCIFKILVVRHHVFVVLTHEGSHVKIAVCH